MDRLEAMSVIIAVTETGSISAASRRLNSPVATVSRKVAELESRLQPLGPTRANGLLLRFTYDPYTLTVFPDGRALIQGTTDIGLARSLYARFIGS